MPIQRKKSDLGIEISGYHRPTYIYMASHMPELSVCIIYANF